LGVRTAIEVAIAVHLAGVFVKVEMGMAMSVLPHPPFGFPFASFFLSASGAFHDHKIFPSFLVGWFLSRFGFVCFREGEICLGGGEASCGSGGCQGNGVV
jgi:hypothetical protein